MKRVVTGSEKEEVFATVLFGSVFLRSEDSHAAPAIKKGEKMTTKKSAGLQDNDEESLSSSSSSISMSDGPREDAEKKVECAKWRDVDDESVSEGGVSAAYSKSVAHQDASWALAVADSDTTTLKTST